jgi:hypothetical protein
MLKIQSDLSILGVVKKVCKSAFTDLILFSLRPVCCLYFKKLSNYKNNEAINNLDNKFQIHLFFNNFTCTVEESKFIKDEVTMYVLILCSF